MPVTAIKKCMMNTIIKGIGMMARKDIGLALTAGASRKIPMSTGSVAREFYNFASAAGHGEDDWTTGIFRAMKSISKISLWE